MSDSDALVNPALLRWARESTNLDIENAAKAAKVTNPAKFAAAELGEARISFRQLQNFALYCRIPLHVFYLPEPPLEEASPADFRSSHGVQSSRLVRTLRLARSRRDAALDLFADLGIRIPEMPTVRTSEDVLAILKPLLCIPMWGDNYRRSGWSQGAKALSATKERVEHHLPVLIFEFIIETTDLAGCSLYGAPLSVVGLSQKDTPNRRRFTLAHELVHVLFRESGMCDPSDNHDEGLERRCDAIASEALMPEQLLTEELRESAHRGAQQKASYLADRYGLSHSAAAVRMFRSGALSKEELSRLLNYYEAAYKRVKEELANSEGGPSPYLMQAQRLGPTFTNAVLNGIQSDLVSVTQAASLLGVPPSYKSFEKIREKMVNVYGR